MERLRRLLYASFCQLIAAARRTVRWRRQHCIQLFCHIVGNPLLQVSVLIESWGEIYLDLLVASILHTGVVTVVNGNVDVLGELLRHLLHLVFKRKLLFFHRCDFGSGLFKFVVQRLIDSKLLVQLALEVLLTDARVSRHRQCVLFGEAFTDRCHVSRSRFVFE